MSTEDLKATLNKVNTAIAAQEALRGTLPNAQIEATLATLHPMRATLEAKLGQPASSSYQATVVKGSGAIAQGSGATSVGERGVSVGGNVGGSIVTGDQVGGDQYTVGDISDSTGIAIGPHATATVTEGVSGPELAQLFQTVAQQIAARPADPDVDKKEIADVVAQIEKETRTREAPNENKLERWLRHLAQMAPDILDVIAASMISPVTGTTAVLKKIVDKVKKENKA